VSFLLEGYSFSVAMAEINRERGERGFLEFLREGDDPTGVGVLLEDSAALIGLVLALAGVGLSQWLASPYPDAVATLVIAALLGWVAVFLARSNGRLLLGASIGSRGERKILEALNADEVVERVEDLKTTIIGAGRVRVKAEIDIQEKFLALRMRAQLEEDARRLRGGEDPARVLTDLAAQVVHATAGEIARLHKVIDDAVPEAAHVDLELISGPAAPGADGARGEPVG
jgi:hypothetical protein